MDSTMTIYYLDSKGQTFLSEPFNPLTTVILTDSKGIVFPNVITTEV